MMVGRRSGGPETYELNLSRALVDVAPEHEFHFYCTDEEAVQRLTVARPNVHYRLLRPRVRWISVPVSLPLHLRRDQIDVLHATFVPPPHAGVPYVFTMHDVSMFEHPEFYPASVRFRLVRGIERGLRKAAVVLCISEHCRQSVLDRFDLDPERVRVAYHGVGPEYAPPESEAEGAAVRARLGVRDAYFFYVGKYEKRKNLLQLVRAFHAHRQSGGRESLVLAGNKVWNDHSVPEEIARLGLEDAVQELGYVADEDLPALYAGAKAFVFPTLWEGFGLPVLEAMACGAPVICSNRTCLPEIAGDAALLVDPESTDELAGAMAQIGNANMAGTLRSRGRARASEFTWKNSALATIEAYEQILNASS